MNFIKNVIKTSLVVTSAVALFSCQPVAASIAKEKPIVQQMLIASGASTKAEAAKLCDEYAGMSKYIMEVRQLNISMQKALVVSNGDALLDEYTYRAYDSPVFSTEEYKQEAIKKFFNENFLECMNYARKYKQPSQIKNL